MPNNLNFEFNFYYFLIGSLMIYPPGLYYLYTHMLIARSRALSHEKLE